MEEIEELDKDLIYIDEELPEIEYYEILTLDEIIEENPNFIAFTKKEIYNELYDIFNNSNKTNNFIDLFYNIVKEKDVNTTNYILVSDSYKKKYKENDNPKEEYEEPEFGLREFINQFKKINKIKDINLASSEKNKLFFTIEYPYNSNFVRFKPVYKTNIKINDDNDTYVLNKNDDTNIPIKQIYYKTPKYLENETLSNKILAHYNEQIDMRVVETTTDINKDFLEAKPTFNEVLEKIDLEELKNIEEINYTLLSNIFEKFDLILDNINLDELNILKDYLQNIIKDISEEKIKLKPVKYKLYNYINHKINVYNHINNIFKLLKFNEDTIDEHNNTIIKLEDYKSELNNVDILYDNIYDVTQAINNKDVDTKTVIENIKNIIEIQRLTNIIDTIKKYNNNDLDEIEVLYNIEKENFENLNNYKQNFTNNSTLKFINISSELSEIKVQNNNTDYMFIDNADIENNNFYDYDNKDDIDIEENIETNYNQFNNLNLNKHIEKADFINAQGFKEHTRYVLEIINKIEEVCKLTVDYDYILNEIYKEYSYLPTKYYLLKTKINEQDANISDTVITNISNISFYNILNNVSSVEQQLSQIIKVDDKIIKIIIDINKEYLENVKQIFYSFVSLWILNIQENIVNDVHIHDYNYSYIHLWDDYGFPINKTKKVGVTIYLCDIITSVFQDNESYNIYNIDLKIIKIVTDLIDGRYEAILNKIKYLIGDGKISNINRNKGKKYQMELVDNLNTFKKTKTIQLKNTMLDNYVNALIYMPGINYNRIHKYLLGCCLQKIDKNYVSDMDMIGKRNDLMAAKNYFGKNRQNLKNREIYYLPYPIEDKVDEILNDNENEFEKIDYDISNDFVINKYDNWLNICNNDEKFTLFNKDDIDNIKKMGSNEIIKIITKYLNNYLKTINVTRSSLINDYINNINTLNFKQLSNVVIQMLSKMYHQDTTDEILEYSIEYYKFLINKINELNNLNDTNNITNIIRTKAYITILILTLPYNTNNIIGDKFQLIINTDNADDNKYRELSKMIHDNVIKVIKQSKMPTYEENKNFIDKMREEFKNKKLELFDKQNEEQRKVFNELTKIGIKVENINQEDLDIDNNDENGEEEYFMNGNNDDQDPDDLDNDDHEHMYDD